MGILRGGPKFEARGALPLAGSEHPGSSLSSWTCFSVLPCCPMLSHVLPCSPMLIPSGTGGDEFDFWVLDTLLHFPFHLTFYIFPLFWDIWFQDAHSLKKTFYGSKTLNISEYLGMSRSRGKTFYGSQNFKCRGQNWRQLSGAICLTVFSKSLLQKKRTKTAKIWKWMKMRTFFQVGLQKKFGSQE